MDFPWVGVPNLASYILSRMAGRLSADWERIYEHPIYFWKHSSDGRSRTFTWKEYIAGLSTAHNIW